jgi:NAD-dependent dihydropyrimidine dehydrogenase PreA subunit
MMEVASGNWLPVIGPERCTGCGDCAAVCSPECLALSDGTAVVVQPDDCNYCGACELICPAAAIALPYQVVLASDL